MRTLILTLLIGIGLTSCRISSKQDFSNEDVEKKHVVLQDFSGIKVSEGIEVEIVPGNKNEAYVESNVMEYLQMEVEDNTLVIGYEGWYIGNMKTRVKLIAKNIENFKANSSGEIKVKGQFDTEQANINVSSSGEVKYDFKGKVLNISASSSGEVEGNIMVEELNIDASSSADVELKGNTDRALITASSSADVESKNLKVKKARIEASSSADVELSILESIDAHASSSGDIIYQAIGNVKTNVRTSSSGSVKEVDSF